MAGCLIAFEGIDGSGKSTQVKRLASALRSAHHPVCVTREPTDGEYGRTIRALSTRGAKISLQEELELFEKDRREHVDGLIAPALERGEVVITDRYFLSTAAYQGARGLDGDAILRSHEGLFPIPDAVFFIDVPVGAALLRVEARGEEKNQAYEKRDFLEDVASRFRAFERDYIYAVAGEGSESEVHAAVCDHFIRGRGLPDLQP